VRDALGDYLNLRRALGFQLANAGRLLGQFVGYLEAHDMDTVTTERGARTMTVDPTNHRIYMLAAEYGPPAEGKDGKKGRPTVVPDSFHVLVIGK